MRIDPFEMVLALQERDGFSGVHCLRTALWASLAAVHLGMGQDDLHLVAIAAFLHDVGKLLVPVSVLTKPGPLTPDERRVMHMHPVDGYALTRTVSPSASGIILEHHERLDGSGYPRGLSHGQIDLRAALLAVADVFDALISRRPYRKALTPAQAIHHLIREAGRLYLPRAVRALTKSLSPLIRT